MFSGGKNIRRNRGAGARRQQAKRAGTDHIDDAPDGRLVGAPQREGRLDDLHGHERARDAADARAAQHARLRGQPDQPAGDGAEDRAHCMPVPQHQVEPRRCTYVVGLAK